MKYREAPSRRTRCVNGCGRMSQRPDGICASCIDGKGVPRVRVDLLPLDYLVSCVAELARRREEINAALQKVTP